MPAIRIIGQLPEGVRDLPEQLRVRGYDIETGADTNSREGFEITLEECPADEALSRALALAENDDISILVAPRTIVPAQVLDWTKTETQLFEDSPPGSPDTATLNPAEYEPEAPAYKEEIAQEQPSAANDLTALVHDISPAAAESIEAPPQPEEPEPVYFAGGAPSDAPLELATESTPFLEPLPEQEEFPISGEIDLFVHQEFRELSADAAELRDAPEVPETEPQDEPAALPDTDWIEPEPVAALRLNADDDSDWPIWQVGGEDEQAPRSALPQSESPILTEHITALRSLSRRVIASAQASKVRADERLFTRIATLTAVLAILLLLVGVTAHRFSPLPSGILHGSSQTSQPAPLQRPAAATAPTTASEVIPPDAAEPANPHGTPPSADSGMQQSSKPAARNSHKSPSGDDNYIAKDTVVRYHQRPKEPLRQTAKKQSGVKYYTDLKQ